jgi:hypothetical protein
VRSLIWFRASWPTEVSKGYDPSPFLLRLLAATSILIGMCTAAFAEPVPRSSLLGDVLDECSKAPEEYCYVDRLIEIEPKEICYLADEVLAGSAKAVERAINECLTHRLFGSSSPFNVQYFTRSDVIVDGASNDEAASETVSFLYSVTICNDQRARMSGLLHLDQDRVLVSVIIDVPKLCSQ